MFNILGPRENRLITASGGIIALQDDPEMFVIIKNKRGWDIPGGHVKPHENTLDTFRREFREESGCDLLDADLIAILESKKDPTTGIAVFSGECLPGNFVRSHEIEDMKFVSKKELLEKYFGNKTLLQKLFDLLT